MTKIVTVMSEVMKEKLKDTLFSDGRLKRNMAKFRLSSALCWRMNEWLNKWIDQLMNGFMNAWLHACMHACSSMNDEWCCNRPFLCLLRMRDRKRPTDRPSDRRTNMNSYRYARPHLKRRDIAEVWAVNEVRVIEKAIQRLTRQTRCLYCLTEMTTITMTTTTKAKTDFDNDRGVKLWLWWNPTPRRRLADSTPTPRPRHAALS